METIKEIENRIIQIEERIFFEKMAENADLSYISFLQAELRGLRAELERLKDGE